jgi:curved DNA-binding protein CbpA
LQEEYQRSYFLLIDGKPTNTWWKTMEPSEFVDYYEALEISPNANSGTIERMFRYFAQRYHPDNPETGDRFRFDTVVEAHDALKDPVRRAQYDIEYQNRLNGGRTFSARIRDTGGIGQGIDIQNNLLSLLYVKRRQSVREPGLGEIELERLSGCPGEHLEFHLWYLKEKGWIKRTENGTFAITVEGVDRANTEHHRKATEKLLTHQSDLKRDEI